MAFRQLWREIGFGSCLGNLSKCELAGSAALGAKWTFGVSCRFENDQKQSIATTKSSIGQKGACMLWHWTAAHDVHPG